MFKFIFPLLITINAYAGWHDYCPNEDLENEGFIIHKQEKFEQDVDFVQHWLTDKEANFKLDVEEVTWSFVYNKYVIVSSFATHLTPSMEMLGDVFIVQDEETNEILEVRWYKNGQRHLSYNEKKQPCATILIPIPINSLF